MKYPTIEEVQAADINQLAIWYRFLPSPGMTGRGKECSFKNENMIIELVFERFAAFGGMNPTLSKEIGWDYARYGS